MELHPHERLAIGCLRLCAVFAVVLVCVSGGVLFVAWRQTPAHEPPPGYLGLPQRGRTLLPYYGCPACHVIPGAAPQGMVGPSLTGMGDRSYIAGRFSNKPIDMEEWLLHPQTMKPGTAMPDLNVTERDARDIASYLATLKNE
jgi:cytochrome c1